MGRWRIIRHGCGGNKPYVLHQPRHQAATHDGSETGFKLHGMNLATRIVIALTMMSLFIGNALADDSATSGISRCFSTSDQVRLCYQEQLIENHPSPILVFIPGWTMPASIWSKQLSFFAGKRSTIAFDPRGQGLSDAPQSGYSLERRVQDIAELLNQFPDRHFVLVGWSLGVLESLAYLRQVGPDRIDGLILVDNSIGEGTVTAGRKGKSPFFEALRKNRAQTMRAFIAAMFRSPPGSEITGSILASAMKTSLENSLRLLSYPKPRSYWNDVLYEVALPTLYLVTPKWQQQANGLIARHPNAKAKIFPHAKHALFWDDADQFNQAVEEFVAPL
ncbi:alpha/beta fold hydrolase [Chitinimonas sp. PSY-7]|uniref:alpha/beta fold hydrolase n=1 Tax=Chitinimonas sp. PSY-7 TaxID=3459088 RepID=UPI0040400DF9